MGNELSIEELNEGIEQREFTREELKAFQGQDGNPLYVAIYRKVILLNF